MNKVKIATAIMIPAVVLGGLCASITEHTVSHVAYPNPAAFCFESMSAADCNAEKNLLRHTKAYGWPDQALTRTDDSIPAKNRIGTTLSYRPFALQIPFRYVNWAIFTACFTAIGLIVVTVRQFIIRARS